MFASVNWLDLSTEISPNQAYVKQTFKQVLKK